MVLNSPPPHPPDADLDRVFHALAHSARRSILRRLSDREHTLGELAAPLKMSFPAASKHVRVLEQARLVQRRIVGRTHICWIEAAPLAQANQWLEEYRRIWEANFQRLDAILGELGGEPPPSPPPPASPATAATSATPKHKPRSPRRRKRPNR